MSIRIVNSIFDNAVVFFQPTDDATSKSRLEMAFNTAVVRTTNVIRGCAATSNLNKITLVENNIFVNTTGQDVIDGPRCTTANNILSQQATVIPGSNMIRDPMLVDPANHDFRLRSGSPAIDAAVPSTGLDPDHDFAGTPRPQGAKKDIGAFELTP